MTDYTPTTALMREWHVRGDHAGDKSRAEYEAEFDRWLEAHDREVAVGERCAAMLEVLDLLSARGGWGCVLGGRVESDYNANHDQNMI